MKKNGPTFDLRESLLERLANTLPFLSIILFTGGWVAGFFALQESGPGAALEGLRCLIFFGGLAGAVLLGATAGSFLKRLIWKFLHRDKGGGK